MSEIFAHINYDAMRNSSVIFFFIAGVVFIIFVNEASLEIKSVAYAAEIYDVLPRGDIAMMNADIKKDASKEGEKKYFSDPDFSST